MGTGERCGNVNLTTVIGAMQLRGEAEFVSAEALTGLTSLAHSAYAAFGLEAPHGAPIVGPGAFGTWAGMHGSQRTQKSRARIFGAIRRRWARTPTIGVNAQSGRANIMLLSESLGVPLNSAQAQALMDANLAMIEGGGFTASEVSFPPGLHARAGHAAQLVQREELASLRRVRRDRQPFCAGVYDALSGRLYVATARAEGAGPVDALTKAMRRELEKWYPALAEMRLGTFTVTALDVSAHDSAAHVRVTVSFQPMVTSHGQRRA